MLKKAAVMQDLSCLGKCSLTIALPVISAAGIEVCCIPTAVLSTHTGGLGKNTFRDLTGDIEGIIEHWSQLDVKFDCIYTGYLASRQQIKLASDFIERFGREAYIAIDPAMADKGQLYKGLPEDIVSGMSELCKKANVIMPNLTEAHLLLELPYEPYADESRARMLIQALGSKYKSSVVLTGVSLKEDFTGCAVLDIATGNTYIIEKARANGEFHGTGDLFASCLVSAFLKGFDLRAASDIAAEFTAAAVERTLKSGTDERFGVNFEECLPYLLKLLCCEVYENGV